MLRRRPRVRRSRLCLVAHWNSHAPRRRRYAPEAWDDTASGSPRKTAVLPEVERIYRANAERIEPYLNHLHYSFMPDEL